MVLSFLVFPKPMSWKYLVGGGLVALALFWLQRAGKRPAADKDKDKERDSDGGGGNGGGGGQGGGGELEGEGEGGLRRRTRKGFRVSRVGPCGLLAYLSELSIFVLWMYGST